MSAISGAGRAVLDLPVFRAAHHSVTAPPAAQSGSVTGSAGALSGAARLPVLNAGTINEIEKAVTAALQSAKPTDDPRKVVRDAIAAALKKTAGTPADGEGDEGQIAADADGTHRTFVQTLAAYGISPQQFRAD